MKTKLFNAAVAVTSRTHVGYEWVVQSPNAEIDGLMNEVVFSLEEEARAASATDEHDTTCFCRRKMVTRTNVIVPFEALETQSKCNDWISKTRAGYQIDGKNIDGIVNVVDTQNEFIVDTDGLMEHRPKYKVRLEVKTTKYIDVEIDSGLHDSIEDEYDAGEVARDLCEDGEYDNDLDCTYADNIDVNVESSEEE